MLETQFICSRDEKRKGLVSRIWSGDLTVSNKEMLEAFRIETSWTWHSRPLDQKAAEEIRI
jgi:hypothetical protein|tara:strand:+ start:504 stop:686 length:183 start_codon:yes stop_codon:yes gene_type:complete